MKRELWPKIKVGSWVIYADEYAGVFKAKVIETDIRVYEPGTPSRWGYPYGMTEKTGTVKIRYDTQELIENLANLVKYGPAKFEKLRRAWQEWQTVKRDAEAYREAFLDLAQQYKEL